MTSSSEVLSDLKGRSDQHNVDGMARFGITGKNVLGISIKDLRAMAKDLGRSHELAAELWASEIHEARILASMVDEPSEVGPEQLEAWVVDFDSWDLCDQCCSNLFSKVPGIEKFVWSWADRQEEFVKRAAFTLIAQVAVHHKDLPDDAFRPYFALIERYSSDERNFVKKSVNWALRQIGKRSNGLRIEAVELAQHLIESDSKAARWIGRDAHRELTSEKTISQIKP